MIAITENPKSFLFQLRLFFQDYPYFSWVFVLEFYVFEYKTETLTPSKVRSYKSFMMFLLFVFNSVGIDRLRKNARSIPNAKLVSSSAQYWNNLW